MSDPRDRDRDLREAEPDDIQQAITRALVSAKAVRAQTPPAVDGRCLALVLTKLEEAEMWLGRGR